MNNLIYEISRLITEDPDIFLESEIVPNTDGFYEKEVLKWRKITGSEVVKVLITTKEGKKVMAALGVKIYMANGGWWFVSRKYGSWTYHFPIRQKLNKFFEPVFDKNNQPVMAPEVKNRWSSEEFEKDFGTRSPEWFDQLIDTYYDTKTWYDLKAEPNTDMRAADFTDLLDDRRHISWKTGKRRRRKDESDDDAMDYYERFNDLQSEE